MRFIRTARASLLAATFLTVASGIADAQHAGACKGQFDCFEVATFVANVTDFRVSGTDTRTATATVRFLNKAAHPLILGFVDGSGIVTDDQGNRYLADGQNAVRGIGEISRNAVDSKFSLEASEASDTRFEFTFRPQRNQILGTTYEMEMTVREILPLPGNQFRLGKEFALTFKGFGATKAVAGAVPGASSSQPGAPSGAAGVTAAPAAPVAATPATDPCGATPRCYNAGKFTATISQISSSTRKEPGRTYYNVKMTLKIRNVSSVPIVLGYLGESGQLTDDAGNRYIGDRGSSSPFVHGIGVVNGRGADPQFSLAPGEVHDAMLDNEFKMWNNEPVTLGTILSYDLTLEELEILPSKQVRSTRSYAIGFHDMKQSTKEKGKSLFDGLIPTITTKKPPVH